MFIKMIEELMRENFKGLDWNVICTEEILSIDFIRQFKDELDWDQLSWNQIFTEKQIEEFRDYIHNWYNIIINQDVSGKFLEKWRDKFHGAN